ncbi:hypothetical protein [Bradyrhizobium lablabi]|uniref:hypothetical protein n=1 Tax=Bradyrhizobium lablabi TaxID=722472 RepID=UPI001BAA304F|nr:hypothetical protein [Bradyrhizobium lablabi]MBR0695279.1 hypothetical protein [Bradyrhizobium lablabi]
MARPYDEKFISYAATSSRYAASRVIPILRSSLDIASVVDIGCAGGGWLSVWQQEGIADIRGVDGDYVRLEDLEIGPDLFTSADLSRPLKLGRTFDLVESLEVAEHIDETSADNFVASLVSHAGKYILFSAAVPGQGGEYHVNEQPYDYWRMRLKPHGFDAYDFVRPRIMNDARISFWYRYNCILYVHRSHQAALNQRVQATRVSDGEPIRDLSPRWFRMRKGVVKLLSPETRDRLARLKARVAPTGRF